MINMFLLGKSTNSSSHSTSSNMLVVQKTTSESLVDCARSIECRERGRLSTKTLQKHSVNPNSEINANNVDIFRPSALIGATPLPAN